MKDIDGDGFGGVVESEERSRDGTEESCGLRGSCCGGLKGSCCGGLSMENKSQMQIFLDTIIDVRRLCDSMYIYESSHALPQNVVDELCRPLDHLSRSAEPVVTQRLARHKRNKNVRFYVNKRVNDNNDDECGCNNGVGLVT